MIRSPALYHSIMAAVQELENKNFCRESDVGHKSKVFDNLRESCTQKDDYDWQPPSEAEMKIIQARRERSDKISSLMGTYLLKGYKMLGITCPVCDTILLQYKEEGTDTLINYCVACQELDTDTNKDDPVLNSAAALTQMREGTITDIYDTDDLSFMRNITDQQPAPSQNPQTVPQSSVQGTSLVSSTTFTVTDAGHQPLTNGAQVTMLLEETSKVLSEKIHWATEELKRTNSVDYNISLCQMIKSAADALQSVKLTS